MKIIEQFIVETEGKFQVLYVCEEGKYFLTNNGAFGQNPTGIMQISRDFAERILLQS